MLVFFFSCEKPGTEIIRCSECSSSEPVKVKIQIKLDKYTKTTVNIYEGNLEDSILYESITTEANTIYRVVSLNRKYTLTAMYSIRGNYYIVVNSITPRVLYDEDYCEEPCYYVYDKDVNLRLKYSKYGNR